MPSVLIMKVNTRFQIKKLHHSKNYYLSTRHMIRLHLVRKVQQNSVLEK